jgi:hypothetical protein
MAFLGADIMGIGMTQLDLHLKGGETKRTSYQDCVVLSTV